MRLLVLVLLLAAAALVVAQSSLPAGVPIVFADGTTISAGNMNANIAAIEEAMGELRDSVIETRQSQVSVREQLTLLSASVLGELPITILNPEGVRVQQDTDPWPFTAGAIVRASEVNAYFSQQAENVNNIAAFNALLLGDMQDHATILSLIEAELELGEWPALPAALPPVEAVTVVQFVNGDLIAAADMNGNFAAVWQGLLELEPGVQALQGYMAEEEERFTAIWAELGVSQPDYSYPACSDLDNPDFSITNILMPSGTQHAFGELLRPTLTFTARYRALPNISGDIYITLEPKFQGTRAAGASVWGAPLEVETETRELLISVNDTGLAQVKVDEIEAKITVRIGGFPGIHQGVLVRCSIPVDYTFQKAQ